MSQEEKKKCINILGIALNSLSSIIELTQTLHDLIDREFNGITQNEGYEILRYLLTANGISFHTSSSYLILKNSDVLPSTKHIIEKFKGDIIQSLKDVFKKNKIEINLRKSDMINPNSVKYLKCSVLLANTALNHQSRKFGIYLPPDSEISKIEKHEIEHLQKLQKELNDVIEKESNAIKEQQIHCLKGIEIIKKELNESANFKIEIAKLLKEVINNCPDDVKEGSSNLQEILKNYSRKVDEMHLNNSSKLNKLKIINQNLIELNSYIHSDRSRTIVEIDAKGFQTSETSKFCVENNIEETSKDQLELDCLLKILQMSIPQNSVLEESSFKNLVQLKIPVCETENLLETYKSQYEKLKALLERNQSSKDNEDSVDDSNWIKDHLTVVPQLSFQERGAQVMPLRNHPFIGVSQPTFNFRCMTQTHIESNVLYLRYDASNLGIDFGKLEKLIEPNEVKNSSPV